MIPLKMRRLFFGFTPRRLLGINGSILADCPSLSQNKFARICWPPIRLTIPLNLNMVNWVLTLVQLHAGALVVGADPFLSGRREQLVALASRHAVPAIYAWREFADSG